MHTVTVTAIHFAFENWMRKRLHRLAAFYLMAVIAHVWLRRHLQHRIVRGVTHVTVGTIDFVASVRAGVPAKTDVTIVTIKAHAILRFDRRNGFGTESGNRWTLLAPAHAPRVLVAWSVAGFTLQLAVPKRAARVGWHRVQGLENGERSVVIVACETGISTLPAERRILSIDACCCNDQYHDHRNS
jgi:hypothetical protein